MKTISVLISGLAGATTLTLLHQIVKSTSGKAPRMDKMGEQGVAKLFHAAGKTKPANSYSLAMAGDMLANTAYYALAGIIGSNSLQSGAALGVLAGAGALVLPGKLGLNPSYSNRTTTTKWWTVAIYLAGGLVAGALHQSLDLKREKE